MVENLMGEELVVSSAGPLFGIVDGIVSMKVVSAVEVIVRMIVVGVGASVSTIVENSVVTSILVVGGSVEAGAVTVVAAGAPDEPPTATTEYDAVCRRNRRSMGDA